MTSTPTAPDRQDAGPDASADSGLARWWQGLGVGPRVLVASLGFVVVVNVALAGVRSIVGGEPGGPTSSSFSTGSSGLEGYADLLRADGHRVVRLQDRPTAGDLPVTATAVVADPSGIGATEARRLADFVSGGGRLVLAGEASAPLLQGLTGARAHWDEVDPVEELRVWLPVEDTGSARRLAGDAGGRWRGTGPLLPVAGDPDAPGDGAAVVVGPIGAGRVVALADAEPLQNANLARSDNAAFALAAAGPASRPVVFVESVHGFDGEGLAAVPSSWKWVAAGLGVALVAGLWSAGARFGPPEPQRRALRPPRRDHVDAVAADLDRVTRSPAEAAEPLARATRSAMAERLGTADDASPAVLHAAAVRVGEDPRPIELLAVPPADLSAALAVGALAAERQRRLYARPSPADGAPPDAAPVPAAPPHDATGATP